MKKALVFLMTAVMALNVCACGGKAETAKQETAEEKTVEEEAAVDTAAQEEEAFKPEKDISFNRWHLTQVEQQISRQELSQKYMFKICGRKCGSQQHYRFRRTGSGRTGKSDGSGWLHLVACSGRILSAGSAW